MDMRKAFPSKYLKASDLDGKPRVLTMLTVKLEMMKGRDGGADEPKPILYFNDNDKGLVLNKTNYGKIEDEFGPESDDWKGHQIVLFPAMVDAFGETVEAIRVRMPKRVSTTSRAPVQPPVDEPPAHTDEDIPF